MSTNHETPPTARVVGASEFRDICLELLDDVVEGGGEVIITRDGEPGAKLMRYSSVAKPAIPQQERPESLFGLHRGVYEVIGDIDEVPLFVEWDADAWAPVADPRVLKGKPEWLSRIGADGRKSGAGLDDAGREMGPDDATGKDREGVA